MCGHVVPAPSSSWRHGLRIIDHWQSTQQEQMRHRAAQDLDVSTLAGLRPFIHCLGQARAGKDQNRQHPSSVRVAPSTHAGSACRFRKPDPAPHCELANRPAQRNRPKNKHRDGASQITDRDSRGESIAGHRQSASGHRRLRVRLTPDHLPIAKGREGREGLACVRACAIVSSHANPRLSTAEALVQWRASTHPHQAACQTHCGHPYARCFRRWRCIGNG